MRDLDNPRQAKRSVGISDSIEYLRLAEAH